MLVEASSVKSTKIFVVLFLLLLGVLFFIQSCSDMYNSSQPFQTFVTIKLDLSSILKPSRNQSTTEYTLKIFVYNAASYNPGDKIEKLPILAQSSNRIDTSGIVNTTLQVPVDYKTIFVAKLYPIIDLSTGKESEEALYYGESEVIKIMPKNNKIQLMLKKINVNTDVDVGIDILFYVEFNSLGGNSIKNQEIEKDKTATEPTSPTKVGYVFDGWYTSSDGGITLETKYDFTTPITNDVTLYAKWLQGTGTPYTIEHYQQNLKNNEYTFYESEKRFGTTDTKTSSTAKAYEGFTAKGFEEQTILADGTTVVEIYYDRKSYTVSFDSKAGNPESYESQTLKYEQTATEPIFPTKTGYTFDGWYTSSETGTQAGTAGVLQAQKAGGGRECVSRPDTGSGTGAGSVGSNSRAQE